jgi:hypothetical protein
MKNICLVALLVVPLGALAQTAANNNATSSATTSAQGNNQQVVFANPSEVTSTQNIVNSGLSKNIVEYQGSYTIKNVPSVNGPNLITSNDTCMGSSSASVNGPGIGIGFGSTWTDDQCKRLKMSRELWNKGMKAASLAMDCMDPAAKAALEMTGTQCPQSMTPAERVAAFGPAANASHQVGVVAQTKAMPTTPAPVPVAAIAPEPVGAIATPVRRGTVSTNETAPDDLSLVAALAPFQQ